MFNVDAEDLIARHSGGLSPADRAAFRRAAESTVATSPECSGEGSTYRVITKLWRSYFHPPRNRVRLQPSVQEVMRCEAVIGWGTQYLRTFDPLCAAVNEVELAHSLERDAGGGYAQAWRLRRHLAAAP
jgi:hypothetical protein